MSDISPEDARRLGDEAVRSIREASDLASVAAATDRAIGRGSPLGEMRRSLGAQPTDVRRELGRLLNEISADIGRAAATRQEEIDAEAEAERLRAERLDLTEVRQMQRPGRIHPLARITEEVEDVLLGLGFQVLDLPVGGGSDRWPWEREALTELGPPIYVVCPGRVHRNEARDATHPATFHQLEALVVAEGITFGHLAGTIEAFATAYFGEGFTSRLRPSYLPFTEPSAEFDIRRPDGTWLELGRCGMVHPDVLRDGGIDPERYTGFAFGFGIDRLALARHGVPDLRELLSVDVRFLEQL